MEELIPAKEELDEIKKIDRTKLKQSVIDDIIAYQNGDNEKLGDILKNNEGLVRSVYQKRFFHLTGSILDEDDFLQAGRMGLMKAATKFDPSLGYQFSTYALWWIRHEMHSLTRTGEHIRLPEHVAACADRIRVYCNQRSADEKPFPLKEEVVEHFCKENAKLKGDYEHAYDHILNEYICIDEPIGEFQDTYRHEVMDLEQNDFTSLSDNQNVIEQLLQCLSKREKMVIRYRMFYEYSFREIADIMHISRARVGQLETRAIKKMRIRAMKLRLYPEFQVRFAPVMWQKG